MSLDAMKQALSAIEAMLNFINCRSLQTNPFDENVRAMYALRAAIDQAQDPVAWMNPSWIDPDTRGWASDSFESIQIEGWIPLYTAPRQWQGLTQREIDELWDLHHDDYGNALSATGYERAIEAKLRERNA